MSFYSKRHYRAVGGFYSRETPEAIAERKERARKLALVVADCDARFPVITMENAAEAIAFQAERMKFHGHST